MVFHDLLYEEEGPDGCHIDQVLENGSAVAFFPDKKDQAKIEGFKPCPICIGET
jgi:hypothetical protein